jgi:hypothetical protein
MIDNSNTHSLSQGKSPISSRLGKTRLGVNLVPPFYSRQKGVPRKLVPPFYSETRYGGLVITVKPVPLASLEKDGYRAGDRNRKTEKIDTFHMSTTGSTNEDDLTAGGFMAIYRLSDRNRSGLATCRPKANHKHRPERPLECLPVGCNASQPLLGVQQQMNSRCRQCVACRSMKQQPHTRHPRKHRRDRVPLLAAHAGQRR